MTDPFEDPGTPLTNAVLARRPQLRARTVSYVPTGWDAVAAEALEAIAQLAEDSGVPILIAQFKEKLGEFRIYVDLDEDSIGPVEIVADTPHHLTFRSSATPGTVRARTMEIIDAAAARCSTICQRCGAPGQLQNSKGWLHVACDQHARR